MERIHPLNFSAIEQMTDIPYPKKLTDIIRELINNSIDAEATDIVISIMGSGAISITVTDNGTGILPDDMDKICKFHYTSKVGENISDKTPIKTFGFHGISLAAISTLAEVNIESKHYSQNKSYECRYQFSTPLSQITEKTGRTQPGTTVTLKNLFKNNTNLPITTKNKEATLKLIPIITKYSIIYRNINFTLYAGNMGLHKPIYISEAISSPNYLHSKLNLISNDIILPVCTHVSDIIVNAFIAHVRMPFNTFVISVNGRIIRNSAIKRSLLESFIRTADSFHIFFLALNVPDERLTLSNIGSYSDSFFTEEEISEFVDIFSKLKNYEATSSDPPEGLCDLNTLFNSVDTKIINGEKLKKITEITVARTPDPVSRTISHINPLDSKNYSKNSRQFTTTTYGIFSDQT